MKKKIGLFSLLYVLSLFPLRLIAAGSFEGEVDYKLTAEKVTGNIQYFMKGSHIRVNTDAGGSETSAISDIATSQLFLLFPAKKSFLTLSIEDSDAKNPAGNFSKTGKTDLLLGQKTEEWLYQDGKNQVHIWAVPGMGNFLEVGKVGGNRSAWVSALKQKGLFPLKVLRLDESGKTVSSLEAVKLTAKALAPDLFEVPADYHKMDLTDMGSMLQQIMQSRDAGK